jgi:pimeloyl-ACP methyl ester carboxylesterase
MSDPGRPNGALLPSVKGRWRCSSSTPTSLAPRPFSARGERRAQSRLGGITTRERLERVTRRTPRPWSNNQYLDDLLPNSELHPLDAGHFAWEEAADEYGRLVVDWVNGGYRRVAAG